jgi:hypothetical protein
MYIVVFVNSALTRFLPKTYLSVFETRRRCLSIRAVFAREVVSVAFNRQHVIVVDHGLPEPLNQFFFNQTVAFGGANICNQRRENNLVLSIGKRRHRVVLYGDDVYKIIIVHGSLSAVTVSYTMLYCPVLYIH